MQNKLNPYATEFKMATRHSCPPCAEGRWWRVEKNDVYVHGQPLYFRGCPLKKKAIITKRDMDTAIIQVNGSACKHSYNGQMLSSIIKNRYRELQIGYSLVLTIGDGCSEKSWRHGRLLYNCTKMPSDKAGRYYIEIYHAHGREYSENDFDCTTPYIKF